MSVVPSSNTVSCHSARVRGEGIRSTVTIELSDVWYDDLKLVERGSWVHIIINNYTPPGTLKEVTRCSGIVLVLPGPVVAAVGIASVAGVTEQTGLNIL